MVETYRQNGWTVLAVRGEVNRSVFPHLHNVLVSLCDQDRPAIALDLSEVEDMDSAGINLAVAGLEAASRRGGRMIVLDPPQRIRRQFVSSGLGKLIDIRTSLGQVDA